MINTHKGKRIGRVYIGCYLLPETIARIMAYLSLAPQTIDEHEINWEIIGVSPMFDALDDMETVPTYDIISHKHNALTIEYIEVKRISHGNRKEDI